MIGPVIPFNRLSQRFADNEFGNRLHAGQQPHLPRLGRAAVKDLQSRVQIVFANLFAGKEHCSRNAFSFQHSPEQRLDALVTGKLIKHDFLFRLFA